MKTIIAALLLISSFNASSEEEFGLTQFVVGEYTLVGKANNSDNTYTGKLKISSDNGKLAITRQIGSTTIKGSGAIESAIHDEAKVLRMRFQQHETAFEQTCLVQADLNNYARISCYLYEPNKKTNNPGMEVFFHVRNR
ncbi:MAG: hypothetical protein KUG78_11750 [Kangiellaceae bacterium]|nr:hypothetical protein [Kangiellaceae bacterium]